MDEGRYLAWTRETIEGFAAQQVESGVLPEREAREYAEAAFDTLLPQGMCTPGHHVWSAYDRETEVGYLWLGIREQSDGAECYVYDVAVAPHLRGSGYGRAIMLAGEAKASALDAATIGLNVFGHNSAARRLYDSLGYAVSATSMTRRLDTQGLGTREHFFWTGNDGGTEVGRVGLNVCGPNQGARSLDEQMGFTVASTLMKKDL